MQARAVLLVCVAALFTLTPLMLPEFRGYDPEDFWITISDPAAQPPRVTFLIWFVIYPGLLAHALHGLAKHAEDRAWDANRLMLIAAMLLGIFWVSLAETLPIFASGIMFVMALAALIALFRTGQGSFWQQCQRRSKNRPLGGAKTCHFWLVRVCRVERWRPVNRAHPIAGG